MLHVYYAFAARANLMHYAYKSVTLSRIIHPCSLIFFSDKKHVHSYNKREQPKGKGQEGPPQKKLKDDGLPIVEYHRKAIITIVFGVIRTPPRSCVLQHSSKRIKRIIAILKNSTIHFFPNAPQKGLGSTSAYDVSCYNL